MSMQSDNVQPPDNTSHWHRAAVRSAFVAGLFSAVVCALLVYEYCLRPAEDPLETADYMAMKSLLLHQRDNEEIRGSVTRIDLRARNEYFRHRKFVAIGALLLAGGLAVCVIAVRSAATLQRRLPMPELQATPVDLETQWTGVGRWSVAVLAGLLIVVTAVAWCAFKTDLPQDSKDLAAFLESLSAGTPDDAPGVTPDDTPDDAPDAAPPSAEEIAKNWHRFRGPGGRGVSAYTNVPDSWNVATGENILWKTPVPMPGMNSPVVWGNRIFLTGADENQRKVYCFDVDGGKILWETEVAAPDSPAEPPGSIDFTGYAAPTVTTDGRRVFAMFANGDLAGFDYQGKQVWARSLGLPVNCYGHAASLAMYGGLLLVQFDQGASAKKALSKFYAIDGATGETRWEVARPVPNSWTSPIVINHEDREQIITCCDPWVISYNPKNGKELWRADALGGECGPSPVYAGGLLHVGNEYCRWTAIRPDGEGDVSETDKIVWSADDGLPDTCCPVVTEELVFLLPATSYLTCYDAKTGENLWEFEFEEDVFTSSPSLVGNRLYLFADEGKVFIMEFDRTEAREVARADLGEECATSPAFQDGRIYIRGEKHLFCIGK
ncbi:MAG: PQQ-binding-like beta-propeller repeat protein [Candidatus Nealsonbacteria bacterium]|nr:PQQ-binding-like beta-propeller repeat protein [Candidatus Nealsonbacteria bacterium]